MMAILAFNEVIPCINFLAPINLLVLCFMYKQSSDLQRKLNDLFLNEMSHWAESSCWLQVTF